MCCKQFHLIDISIFVFFSREEFRRSWDLFLSVMKKLVVLSRQWPGLSQHVHTPCKEKGCTAYFVWRDWQNLQISDIYDL